MQILDYLLKRKAKEEKQVGYVTPLTYQVMGKVIEPTFQQQIEYYESDTTVKGAVDELAETCVGHGGYFSIEDERFSKGLDVANDFAEDIDLDGINQVVSRELWATGNSILEKIEPEKIETLVRLPISSFKRIVADEYGNITRVKQVVDGKSQWLDEKAIKRLIWLKWNPIDAKLVGVGLIYPLLKKGLGYRWKDATGKIHEEFRPSYQELMEETEDAMRKVLRRYTPRFCYILKGFSEEDRKTFADSIMVLRPEDDIVMNTKQLVGKQDIAIERLSVDPRSRLDPFIEYFYNKQLTGLQTPTIKLFLEAGFTEASSRTAVQILDRKVDAYRRFHKRFIEREIIKPVVMQRLDWTEETWREAGIRWNWNPIQYPEVSSQDIVFAVREGILTRDEARNFFKKAGVELLEAEAIEQLNSTIRRNK